MLNSKVSLSLIAVAVGLIGCGGITPTHTRPVKTVGGGKSSAKEGMLPHLVILPL